MTLEAAVYVAFKLHHVEEVLLLFNGASAKITETPVRKNNQRLSQQKLTLYEHMSAEHIGLCYSESLHSASCLSSLFLPPV